MQALRKWVLLGGLIVLTPNLMGGCAEDIEDFFRDIANEFDNLADDVDGDDDDLDDFFDDLFGGDDD